MYKQFKIMSWTKPDFDERDGSAVTLEENTIELKQLSFLAEDWGHGLPAIVTWMRALGCVDVKYELVPVPYQR
jgi:hypothetical protein